MGGAVNGLGGGRVGGQLFSCDLTIHLAGKSRAISFLRAPSGLSWSRTTSPPPSLLKPKHQGQFLAAAPGMWGPEIAPSRDRDGRERRGSPFLFEKPGAHCQAYLAAPYRRWSKHAQKDTSPIFSGSFVHESKITINVILFLS